MNGLLAIFSPFTYFQLYVNWKLKFYGLKLRVLHTNNYSIEYWDSENKKPPLILFQAFAAEGKYSWHKQVRLLSKNHRVIIPNLIYFGKSTMRSKAYTLDAQVEGMEELFANLDLKEFNLCGTSYGGVIAAELTLKHPEKVKRLVLTNTPLKYDSFDDVMGILTAFDLETKTELLMPSNHKNLYKLFRISYFKNPLVPRFVFRSIHKKLYKNAPDRRMLVAESDGELEKLRNKDYKIQCPVLLLWGKNDKLCPIRVGEELKAHIGKNATLVLIEKTAHMPNFEKPNQYNKILSEFLD